ncbi:MAG: hypothetical protein LUG12_13775 [Erysipelotrichaceae bacterium]|nr:hypothetical protein [Erysipelotrichaceae bacterium]
MSKLKVFSLKLATEVDAFEVLGLQKENKEDYVMEGYSGGSDSSWTDGGWNDSYANWIDHGWNDSYTKWTDHGWSDSYANWVDHGWNDSYAGWTDGGWNNSGGGCYITSASVEFMGLDDHCYELDTMRRFRDILVEEDDHFRDQILDYYRYSPHIVENINASQNKDEILADIYHNLVEECVKLLEDNRIEEAKSLYTDYYEKLKEEFLDA